MTESTAYKGPRYTVWHDGEQIREFRTLAPLSHAQRRNVAQEYADQLQVFASGIQVIGDREYTRTWRKSALTNHCE